jgi:hypothetical protein
MNWFSSDIHGFERRFSHAVNRNMPRAGPVNGSWSDDNCSVTRTMAVLLNGPLAALCAPML